MHCNIYYMIDLDIFSMELPLTRSFSPENALGLNSGTLCISKDGIVEITFDGVAATENVTFKLALMKKLERSCIGPSLFECIPAEERKFLDQVFAKLQPAI